MRAHIKDNDIDSHHLCASMSEVLGDGCDNCTCEACVPAAAAGLGLDLGKSHIVLCIAKCIPELLNLISADQRYFMVRKPKHSRLACNLADSTVEAALKIHDIVTGQG